MRFVIFEVSCNSKSSHTDKLTKYMFQTLLNMNHKNKKKIKIKIWMISSILQLPDKRNSSNYIIKVLEEEIQKRSFEIPMFSLNIFWCDSNVKYFVI